MSAEVDALPDMLARLKLVAMRDRLDGLLVSTGLEVSPLVGFEYSPFQQVSAF